MLGKASSTSIFSKYGLLLSMEFRKVLMKFTMAMKKQGPDLELNHVRNEKLLMVPNIIRFVFLKIRV